MPRGGRRTGTPGKAYQNRTDLGQNRGPVPMMAATGQQYGRAKQQMDAQRAMPVAPPPAPATGGPGGAPTSPPGPAGPQVIPLGAPTDRPGEPVTAGAPVGPGPGVEAVAPPTGPDSDLRLRLGAMYQAFPTEEIRQLIEMLDSEPV